MPKGVRKSPPRVQVAFRLPQDVFDLLPPPSLKGERVDFVIEAIKEYAKKQKRKAPEPEDVLS